MISACRATASGARSVTGGSSGSKWWYSSTPRTRSALSPSPATWRTYVGMAEAPVGRVLVPGDVRRIVRLLDEEARAPAQEVRAEDVLDRVEDARMPHQPIEPREEQMGLVAKLAADGAAALGFVRLEAAAAARRLLPRQHADRNVEPIAMILGERRR